MRVRTCTRACLAIECFCRVACLDNIEVIKQIQASFVVSPAETPSYFQAASELDLKS